MLVSSTSGGIASTAVSDRHGSTDDNVYRLPGYVDTKYFEGSPTDKWQRKFLWYGGELEYKYALSPKLDIATTFVPGYPDLMAFAVGLSYNPLAPTSTSHQELRPDHPLYVDDRGRSFFLSGKVGRSYRFMKVWM